MGGKIRELLPTKVSFWENRWISLINGAYQPSKSRILRHSETMANHCSMAFTGGIIIAEVVRWMSSPIHSMTMAHCSFDRRPLVHLALGSQNWGPLEEVGLLLLSNHTG